MKKLGNPFLFAAKFLVLFFPLLMLASCGGGPSAPAVVVTYPGLVGIDDTNANEPILTIYYHEPPSLIEVKAQIASDFSSDGDIEFDPVTSTYVITQNASPPEYFFGEDSSNADLPEFRAFFDFPLDGSTHQPIIPTDAVIDSATLSVFIDQVSFASTVPTFIDLVQYTPGSGGLIATDFSESPLTPVISGGVNSIEFTFLSTDQGTFVPPIDVTPLMQEAQDPGVQSLNDFQLRFVVQSLASGLRTTVKVKRATGPSPRKPK